MRPSGSGDQPAVAAHEGFAQVVVGADHLVRQAQLADQLERRRLGGEETVGAGLDGAAFHVLGLDHAAQARARFEEGAGSAALGQVVGGGKAGDAAADDQGRGIARPPNRSLTVAAPR